MLFRERLAHIEAAAVGIAVRICERYLCCGHCQGRRAEGVFVRGELDRRQIEFAFDLLNGFAGDVRSECANMRCDKIVDPFRHPASGLASSLRRPCESPSMWFTARSTIPFRRARF